MPARQFIAREPAEALNNAASARHPAQLRMAAAYGLSGAAGPLPHLAALQKSFGRHDLSHVPAHTGAQAAAGAQAMGAQAFAYGQRIAFAGMPSLRLAAHEAAHVVQQSAGLQLPGGAGQAGDSHERHADAVAARVTRGASAESLLDAYAPRAPRSGRPHAAQVQRFESEEHQHLGDTATGSASYNLGGAKDKFELTHGDILALSGDVFLPDDLFRLAATPGDHGKKLGTRDEIIWALQDERIWEMRAAKTGLYAGKHDPRFQPGGAYADYFPPPQADNRGFFRRVLSAIGNFFSPDKAAEQAKRDEADRQKVKDAVFQRYQKLGAANAGHFAAPRGRDAAGAPVAGGEDAGGNYRTQHEIAIRLADKASRAGADTGLAKAHEAAAQHFLTDAFSAGHLRTPIALIRSYWGAKYPLFWFNLRHKIALDTAIEMTSGTPITAHYGYTKILESVEAMAPTLPPVTLGDLLGSVFHDVDNEQGVTTKGGGKVMGDAHLDAATEKLAIAAIKAGNNDIDIAAKLGQESNTPVPEADLFGQVRLRGGGTAGKYAPELMMPEPSAAEPPQNWKAPDIDSLWNQPLLGNAGPTVGQTITQRVQGGSIAVQLEALAEKFPPSQSLLHPRAAYLKGFVAKLKANPKAGILDIINWAPHGMSTGDAAQEAAADLARKGQAGDKRENFSGMTPPQRESFVRQLVHEGGGDDQTAILQILATVPGAERRRIYQAIEGHPWAGDFRRHLGSRDDMYKAMDGKNVDRLKDLLNGT